MLVPTFIIVLIIGFISITLVNCIAFCSNSQFPVDSGISHEILDICVTKVSKISSVVQGVYDLDR